MPFDGHGEIRREARALGERGVHHWLAGTRARWDVDIALRAGLTETAGVVPTFASVGLEPRAAAIASIAGSSWDHLAGLLGHRPDIQVLVLSEADWADKCEVELFGLPNADKGTLVVAGTEAGWWSDLAAMAGDDRQGELATVYGGPDGRLDLGDFFDLIAVHEVAHLFCEGQSAFPRMWLGELFANLALHAWVAQRAPDSLRTLTTLPRLAALGSGEEFEHRSRDAFERLYSSVGGPNYVWYQFRLQVAAPALYDAIGEVAVRRLFEAFRIDGGTDRDPQAFDEAIDDDTLAARLSAAVDPMLGTFSLAF
jgi:hypothetical protein